MLVEGQGASSGTTCPTVPLRGITPSLAPGEGPVGMGPPMTDEPLRSEMMRLRRLLRPTSDLGASCLVDVLQANDHQHHEIEDPNQQ